MEQCSFRQLRVQKHFLVLLFPLIRNQAKAVKGAEKTVVVMNVCSLGRAFLLRVPKGT